MLKLEGEGEEMGYFYNSIVFPHRTFVDYKGENISAMEKICQILSG